jgi:alpha-tubulin suppressor-like RCC1 family protein
MGGNEEAAVMRAGAGTRERAVLRRTAAAAVVSLAAGLGMPMLAPQAALATTPGASWISAGRIHSCALDSGEAYCWGLNDFGQLGDGNHAESSVPVAVDTSGVLAGKTLTQISAGGDQSCALDSAGAAYCWGHDVLGGLGDGDGPDSDVPVAVDTSGVLAGKTLTQISSGLLSACALDSAGAAYCWGSGGEGQLGDGSTAPISGVPVAVDTSGVLAGKTLTQISAGNISTCALDSAGAAYCWGNNYLGALGDGSTTDSDVPVAVDTSGVLAGKTLTQISVGEGFACALDSAGAAYCWGNNDGDLGDGSHADSDVPERVVTSGVLAGKTLTQIAAGNVSTCALDSAGAAYCWGINEDGELGDGSINSSPVTVPVAVDTSGVLAGKTLTQISVNYGPACALDSAGAAYCWGENEGGELGDGSSALNSDVPVLAGPQAPTGVTAAPGNTTATVSWTQPGSLDGGTLTGYTATAAPGGAACTTTGATTCTITGLADGTTYTVTVEARTTVGDSGASTPATVTPVRTGQPVFTSPAAVTAAYGARFTFTATATGSPAPRITHTGPLPPGVRFAEESGGRAAITGTPGLTAAGPYRLTLKATNSAGSATQAFTLTITRPPALAAPAAATATTGRAFRLAIKVIGYPAPALAESGQLPVGLAFTSTSRSAVLAGTPAAGTAGSYQVTITATSSSGVATAHLTLTVAQRSRT